MTGSNWPSRGKKITTTKEQQTDTATNLTRAVEYQAEKRGEIRCKCRPRTDDDDQRKDQARMGTRGVGKNRMKHSFSMGSQLPASGTRRLNGEERKCNLKLGSDGDAGTSLEGGGQAAWER